MPATFTITMLAVAVILVLADAPLIPIYAVLGVAAAWQLLVALAAAGSEDAPPLYVDEPDAARDA